MSKNNVTYSHLSLKDRKKLFKDYLADVSNMNFDDIKTHKEFDKIINFFQTLLDMYKKEVIK